MGIFGKWSTGLDAGGEGAESQRGHTGFVAQVKNLQDTFVGYRLIGAEDNRLSGLDRNEVLQHGAQGIVLELSLIDHECATIADVHEDGGF